MKNTKTTTRKTTTRRRKSAFEKPTLKLIAVTVVEVSERTVNDKNGKVKKFACLCLPDDGGEQFTVWVLASEPCPLPNRKAVVLSKHVSKYPQPKLSFVLDV